MRETNTFKNIYGHDVIAFCNDHISDKLKKDGLYEKEDIVFLNSLLEKTDRPVVLDIGANIGNHSLAFAPHAAQIYAFEPIPEVFDVLKRNIGNNKLKNIEAFNFALSDAHGESDIYVVEDGNVGASSFDKRSDHSNSSAVKVRKRVGDDVIADENISKIDFVKIDVEAHEIFVLRGLMETLRKHKPVITMEWNDPLTIERLTGSEELQFLLDEYKVFVLGSNHDRDYWQPKPFSFLRRKLARLLSDRKAVLYGFDPKRLYKNLLLVPKNKLSIVDQKG